MAMPFPLKSKLISPEWAVTSSLSQLTDQVQYTAKKVTPFQYRKQDRYSIGPAMLNSGDTVIPGNIPYQDLVFSTEPAILTAS